MTDDPRDRPTRVLRGPVVPGAPAPPVAAGPVGVDPDWAIGAEDRLRTLQGLLALASILALAALGVAIWALVDDDDSARQGASQGRVAALTERVERLEARPDRPAEPSAAGQVSAADLDALEDDVAELKSQVAKGGGEGDQSGDGAPANSVSALSTRVDELTSQVDALRSQGPSDGTGTTP